MELTETQLADLITSSVDKAIKAINPPDPEQRPGQGRGANVNLRRYSPFPSFKAAVLASRAGRFSDRHAFEADFVQAAKEAFGYTAKEEDDEYAEYKQVGSSIVWPRNLDEARIILETMGERPAAKAVERIDGAIKAIDGRKAMTESSTSTFTGGSAGGFLVPPQFLQSLFAYALSPRVALRNVPGVTVVPVTGVVLNLPRESTRAGGSTAAEAGTLSAQDATLSEQTITIKKQYAFRRWSNELAADSEPAFATFLNRTLARDLGIVQDDQYLNGSGSNANITGLLNYSGLTSGPSLGANGRAWKWDDLLDAVYNLEAANVDTDSLFLITHPRGINTLRKEKDNEGRYVVTGSPVAWGAEGTPTRVLGGLLPYVTTTTLAITNTVGGSTDCSTAIIGDASNVFILERQGIEIFFTEHLYAATDELAVRATARSAVAVLQPAAVELITGIRA